MLLDKTTVTQLNELFFKQESVKLLVDAVKTGVCSVYKKPLKLALVIKDHDMYPPTIRHEFSGINMDKILNILLDDLDEINTKIKNLGGTP